MGPESDNTCLQTNYVGVRLSPAGTVLAACTHVGEVHMLHKAQTGWERMEGASVCAASPDAFAWLSDEAASGNAKGSHASWLVVADCSSCSFYSIAELGGSGNHASQQHTANLVSRMSMAAACTGPLASALGSGARVADIPPGQHAAAALRCRPHSLVADARHRAVALLQYVQGAGAPGCGSAPVHLVATMLQADGGCVTRAAVFPLCWPSACACAALSWQAAAVSGALLPGSPLGIE